MLFFSVGWSLWLLRNDLIFQQRLSIPFRFVRNGRNIPYQFKKQNKFHLILNLGPFRIFRLNSARNVQVSFHMFRSALEKPLNQIEPCSISLIKPSNYKTMILIIILKIIITIFINNDINFLKLDLSLLYMVYIHVVFFMFILCRNLSKIRDALDSISLDNIDVTLYLKYLY
jgi:hypothetical protein